MSITYERYHEDRENRLAAGEALQEVVYDIVRDQFGHTIQYRQAKVRWNREGSTYPTVYGQIDGMLKWNGVPVLVEVKTTTDKNYNYVLKCISEGRMCESLEAYRHQLRTYASLIQFGVCEGWQPPADTSLKTGVLAIMDRNSSAVSLREIPLFSGGPTIGILEDQMKSLELKYGIISAQEEDEERVGRREQKTRRKNKSLAEHFKNTAYSAGRGFADSIARRMGI